jgi:hypothetical protein
MDTDTDSRTDEFWIADEPIRYRVRKTAGGDVFGAGVHITRCEGSDEDCEQALMEIGFDGDTLRLRQYDGDLDAAKMIEADQRAMRYASRPFNIWQRIWKVAMA